MMDGCLRGDKRMKGMESLFHPNEIALIGASSNEAKIGHVILKYLSGWQGTLCLVNPRERSILGRDVYADVSLLPDHMDLAVIALDAHRAVKAARDCADKGFHALAILASGFSEANDQGARLEEELKEYVLSRDTRILGPEHPWTLRSRHRAGYHLCRTWGFNVRSTRERWH